MNSLLEDLIGFARENIGKAGISFAESNQRDRELIDSYKSGSQVNPEQREGLMEEMMNQVNPMAGVFGPIRSKAQKHIAKAIFRRDPETFQAVANSPRQMHINEPPSRLPRDVEDQWIPQQIQVEGGGGVPTHTKWKLPRNANYIHEGKVRKGQNVDDIYSIYGQYADNAVDPAFGGSIVINPRLMRGKSPFGDVGEVPWGGKVHELPGTALHEAQHFLNSPRISQVQSKTGDHLTERNALLWKGRRALVDELTSLLPYDSADIVRGHVRKGNEGRALNEALSYLAEGATRKSDVPEIVEDVFNALKVKPIKGGRNRTPSLPKIMEELAGREVMKRGGFQPIDIGEVAADVPKGEVGRSMAELLDRETRTRLGIKNTKLASEIKPGHARESLTEAEQKLYGKMDFSHARPNIPRETTKPGTLEFWQLLRENPSAAKQFFRRELLSRWDAIQKEKLRSNR